MAKPEAVMIRRYVVSGRVQGVGFRYFVQRAATELGVTGWVRNRADRTVEAEAAGAAEQLEGFEAALRSGPPLARVDRVVVSPAPAPPATATATATEFRITG